MRAQLLLRRFQLLPQLCLCLVVFRQFNFQFTASLTNLARELLGAFPTLGFLGQGFSQPFDLLLHFGLRHLQFLGPCLQPGLFSAGVLLKCE